MTDFFATIKSYLRDYLPKQKCVSANTLKSHRNTLNVFIAYLRNVKKLQIDDITFEAINRQVVLDFLGWLTNERSLSPVTRTQRLSVLRTFLAYAGEVDCANVELEQQVKQIPMGRRKGKVVEFLSENALKTLLEQPDIKRRNGQRDRFFMTLMYDTGARVSELLNMKICDIKIDTENPVVYLRGKGDKERSVPIMPKTAEHCKGYMRIFHPGTEMSSTTLLFYTNLHDERHRISAAAVGKFMQKYGEWARRKCKEVPDRVHPHQLRHTRAIHLYRDGYPLALVGEYLGHVSAETTRIYAYADSEMKRKAIEKANAVHGDASDEVPVWENNEDMLFKLVGLQ
jgi:site-specific recombinase XerD